MIPIHAERHQHQHSATAVTVKNINSNFHKWQLLIIVWYYLYPLCRCHSNTHRIIIGCLLQVAIRCVVVPVRSQNFVNTFYLFCFKSNFKLTWRKYLSRAHHILYHKVHEENCSSEERVRKGRKWKVCKKKWAFSASTVSICLFASINFMNHPTIQMHILHPVRTNERLACLNPGRCKPWASSPLVHNSSRIQTLLVGFLVRRTCTGWYSRVNSQSHVIYSVN